MTQPAPPSFRISRTVRAVCLPLAAIALLPGWTQADEAEAPSSQQARSSQAPLKLEALLEEALENRPALQAAKHEVAAKEAEIGPKGAYDDPMVGVTAMNYPIDTLSPGELGMTGNELALTQRIPFPGKLTQLRNAARHAAEASREIYTRKQLELIREVKLAFYQLYLAHKRHDILGEQIRVIGQLIGVTRSRYTLGKVTQAELLGLQAEEAGLRDQLLLAEKEIAVKIGDLNHAVGRSNHHSLPRPTEVTKTRLKLEQLTEQSLGERVSSRNPGLKGMRSELASAEAKHSFAKWNFLPNFELKVAYTQRQPSPGDRGVDFVSGGVALSIPLWAFSKQSEELKGASAERAKAEAMLDEERIHLLHLVHTMYSELVEASKRLQLYEGGLVPLARQAVISGRSSYLTGKLDYGSLNNLIRNRFQTEFAYNEALVGYESKIAELEALLGEPLGEKL